MESVKDAALRYADDGWSVFPLHSIRDDGSCTCTSPGSGEICTKGSPGKHPRTKNGVLDATTDPDQVEAWFDRWPLSNVGIATGAASGLLVIDVDTKRSVELPNGRLVSEGEDSVHRLEDQFEVLPTTRTVTTGSGGKHYFLRLDGTSGVEIGNRAGVRPSLDIRCDGGYVVAPPSIHASGRRYRWDDDTEPVARVPGWVVDIAKAPTEHVSLSLQPGEVVGEGERNDYLFRVASRLRGVNDLQGLELYGALQAHNLAECSPPLDAEEVRNIAESASRLPSNPESEPLTITASIYDEGEPSRVRNVSAELDGPREERASGLSVGEGEDLAIRLDEFIAEEPEPPIPLVEGLITSGSGIILAGQPNVGKSWLAFDLALAVGSGEKFLGANCTKGTVLIIDKEGTNYGVWKRLNMLLDGRELSTVDVPVYISVGRDVYLDEPRGRSVVRRMVERYRPQLVIFDSLTRFHSGDENNAQAMAGFFNSCKLMMRVYGCSFLFTHHVRKPGIENMDPGDLMRGSSEIRAWPDTIFVAIPTDDEGELTLYHVKTRDTERRRPLKVGMVYDSVRGTAKVEWRGDLDKGVSAATSKVLEMIPKLGMDATEDNLAFELGVTTRTMKEHLKQLVKIGKIRKGVADVYAIA